MSDLKPCPFCGGTEIEFNDTESKYSSLFCDDCGCQMWGSNTEQEAIDKWNGRKEK